MPITELVAVCRDQADDKIIELAVNGHANLIVRGAADLLFLDVLRGIPIVRRQRSCAPGRGSVFCHSRPLVH